MPNEHKVYLTPKYKAETEELIEKINFAIDSNLDLKKRINHLYSDFRNCSTNYIMILSGATILEKIPFNPPYSQTELHSEVYSLQKDPALDCHPAAINEQLQLKKKALIQEQEFLQAEFTRIKTMLQDRVSALFNDFQTQIATMKSSQPKAVIYGFSSSAQSHLVNAVPAFATPPLDTSIPREDTTTTPLRFGDSSHLDSPKRSRMAQPSPKN